jgi:DNA polymerase-4
MLELSQTIGRKLKIFKRKATVVSIFIRDSGMSFKQWQSKLAKPSQSAMYLASEAYELFRHSYDWKKPIRNVTISAQNLIDEDTPYQLDLLIDANREEKFARLDNCIFDLRERFGADSVRNACLLDDLKIRRHGAELMKMPSGMLHMSGE